MYVFSIFLAVGANILYHISQKSIPRGINPAFSVVVTYLVALALSAALLPFTSSQPLRESARELNWASAGVGVAIVGVEFAFLLAYRTGWRISLATLTTNVTVAIVLLPVGLLFFRERLSASNVAGIVLCLAGLLLIAR